MSLTKHNFTKNIEGLFIEINLRKPKLLLFGTFHSTQAVYGSANEDYFKEVGQTLDVYSNYEKFFLAGDFNAEEEEYCLSDFLYEYNAGNSVKEKSCFKSFDNPDCINLFLKTKVLKTLLQYLLVYLFNTEIRRISLKRIFALN